MMQTVELVACDVDGTLLFDYAPALPESTMQAIGALRDNGVVFVPASGRAYDSLCGLFKPFLNGMPLIANNGTIAFLNGEVIFRSVMERELGEALIREILATGDCEVLVTGAHTSYVQPKDPGFPAFMREEVRFHVTEVEDLLAIDEPFTKISAYYPSRDVDEHRWTQRYGDRCSIARAGFGWLDVMPKGTSKALALSAVLERLGIAPENVVALGDEQNDLEMLRLAGTSIAMEWGNLAVIEAADKTTSSAERELRALLS